MSESENNLTKNNINQNDTFDINELTSLNDEITSDFIEQLQSQVIESAKTFSNNTSDGELFEDVKEKKVQQSAPSLNLDIDDNFIKKYKAKLKKQQQGMQEETENVKPQHNELPPEEISYELKNYQNNSVSENNPGDVSEIEKISGGNITERPLTSDIREYSKSLDYTDDNIKYTKYVIYIEPENEEFIESLTVKERKNLINEIIKEQNSIALAKKRFYKFKSFVLHAIITIITISVMVPLMYKIVNASLEITIDNYNNSQSMFETLYKQKGKIKSVR